MKRLLALSALFICSVSVAQTEKLIVPSGVEMTLNTYNDSKEEYIYTVSSANVVMWSAKDQRQMYSFKLEGAVVLSHDGTKLITGNKLYSTVTGKLIYEISLEKGSRVFSDDDEFIYCLAGYVTTCIKTSDGSVAESKELKCYYNDVAINAGDNKIITLGTGGWQICNTQPLAMQPLHTFGDDVSNLKIPAYNRAANTVSVLNLMYGKRSINIYNAETGELVKKIPDATLTEYCILISSYDNNELLVLNGKSYSIMDAASGTITKRGKTDYEFINTFSGLKKTVLASAGYEDKEHGISMYRYNIATGKVTDPFARKLLYTFNANALNDSDAVNIEGRFVIDLTNLKKQDRQLRLYNDRLHATADGNYVLTENATKYELYYTPAADTSKKSINIVPAGMEFSSMLWFVSADGSEVYYTANKKGSLARALYLYDVKTQKTSLLIQPKDLEGMFVNNDRRTIVYFDHDAGLEKTFVKTYDVTNRKLIASREEEEKNNTEDDARVRGQGRYANVGRDSAFLANYSNTLNFYKEGRDKIDINTGLDISNYFFTKNDDYLFTVQSDHTMQVWRTADGKKLGTLYLFDDNNYVFVDEFGRFDGTPEGIKKLYYLKNRKVISLDLVYEKYYTPNLYQRLINGETFPPMPDENLKQAPLVKISYAEKQRNLEVSDDVPSYTNTTGLAEITINALAEEDAIDEIRLFQNGKVLNLATRNLIVEDDRSKTATKKYTISLLPGNNEIRAIALNTQRTESQPDIIHVMYNNGASANTSVTPVVNNNANRMVDQIDRNATLHLIVVGINAYKNPKMSLNYALADATAFKEEVERDAKTVIANVQTYFVTDEAADKTGIVKALQQVQQNTKPQDVFIFYYAGHGVIAEGNKEFYLVPNDVADLHNVDEALKQNGIAAKDLQQYAINIQAQKQLFILDACQSAGAFADMLSSDGNQQKNIAVVARATGTHWMAASGAQQFANEFSTLGHGAFTYVLLQALKGEAASNKMITVDGLKAYMQNGVPALMKKYNGSQQTPASYGFGNDFPVEVLK